LNMVSDEYLEDECRKIDILQINNFELEEAWAFGLSNYSEQEKIKDFVDAI